MHWQKGNYIAQGVNNWSLTGLFNFFIIGIEKEKLFFLNIADETFMEKFEIPADDRATRTRTLQCFSSITRT